jgi:hypothetical protein
MNILRFKMFCLLCFLLLASCKRKWTQADTSEFLSGCMQGSVKDMGAEKAAKYCACLVEKVVARYPNAADARYIRYDTAIIRISKDCLKQP